MNGLQIIIKQILLENDGAAVVNVSGQNSSGSGGVFGKSSGTPSQFSSNKVYGDPNDCRVPQVLGAKKRKGKGKAKSSKSNVAYKRTLPEPMIVRR
jgi:hypothetical protein